MRILLLISLSFGLLGAGCATSKITPTPKDFFTKKEFCAKYIPKLEKQIEEGTGNTALVKVCYSSATNTCLAAETASVVAPGHTTLFRTVQDILTNQVILSEQEQVETAGVENLIQETSNFRERTIEKIDQLGCVN